MATSNLMPNPEVQSVQVNATPSPDPQTQTQDTSNLQIPQQQTQNFNTPAQNTTPPQSGWHRALQSLMGTSTQYQQTLNGIQVQNKPGQLFRSILAGAIMGGAAGEEAHNQNPYGGFMGGFAPGAKAGLQNQQQQGQQAKQDAQQQWQNQLTANKEQREQQSAATEEQVRKAQIAQANTETLRINQAMQGQSFDLHQKLAEAGKNQIKPYVDAGLEPVVAGLSETDHEQYIKDHPGASSLDWELTGTKLGADANGKPTYEGVYTAFDPKGKITVPKATYDQWSKDGVFDRFPEYGSILKDGKQLTSQQYVQVKQDADRVRADNLGRQIQDLNVKKIQGEISKDSAERSRYLTETSRIRQEISDDNLGKSQEVSFNKALQELNKNNGNFDALSPSSRVIIAESMQKMVPALTQTYSRVVADTSDPSSQQKAGELLTQIQSITSLGTRAMAGMGRSAQGSSTSANPVAQIAEKYSRGLSPSASSAVQTLLVSQKPLSEQLSILNSATSMGGNPLTPADKIAALKALTEADKELSPVTEKQRQEEKDATKQVKKAQSAAWWSEPSASKSILQGTNAVTFR